ncbi:SpoIID/LytB domain-containing protein [Eubacteriales bacterium OttesenSCG-928-N14]|nr:SpoIID/LytB domain-containing protein [Eubacteriales bacterium OttesenSCG-928-N14]
MKKRIVTIALAALLVFGLMGPMAPAKALEKNDYTRIRVLLSTGAAQTTDIILSGDYVLRQDPSIIVGAGNYRVSLASGVLTLYQASTAVYSGAVIELIPIMKTSTLSLFNYHYAGTIAYRGNMEFTIVSGGIRVINEVSLETYLYGVVPYEMSDGWPLEALKAQAVCARGYAISQMIASRPSGTYDLGDTSNNQVYRGYDASKANAIQAVEGTKGQVMYHGNSMVQAYYAASNGGQTERTGNVWSRDLPYYVIKDDPYDLANAACVVETSFIPEAYSAETIQQMDAFVYQYLRELARDRVNAMWNSNHMAEQITLLATHEVVPHTPIYDDAQSRCFSQARVVLSVSVTGRDGSYKIEVQMALGNLVYNKTSNPGGIFNRQYNLRMRGAEKCTGGWNITNRRYGHGIGMSQRGAQQMAAVEQWNYQQILAFYYVGTTLKTLDTTPAGGGAVDSNLYQIQNKFITGVTENTKAENFMRCVYASDAAATLTLQDKAGNAKSSGILCTGDKVVLSKDGQTLDSYEVVIYGDVSGDGKIELLDLLIVQRHLLRVSRLEGALLRAGNVTKTGEVALLDLLTIQHHLLGLRKLTQ